MGNTINQLAALGLLTDTEVAHINKVADALGLQPAAAAPDITVRTALQLLRKEIAVSTIDSSVAASLRQIRHRAAIVQLMYKVIQADEMAQYVLDYHGAPYVERLVQRTSDGRRVFVMVPEDLTVSELEYGMDTKVNLVLPTIDYYVDHDAL